MADVDDTLPEWSSTTASNKPTGATTIGTGLDDNLREVQGVVTRWLSHKGSDIASAGTTDIGAVEGLLHDITGTATITGFGTIRSGIWKCLKFEGAAILTHNATSLILPGAANIVTADGDVGIFMSEGSGNWRCLQYMKAAGGTLGPVLGTEQASTSGTAITFTVPPWAKEVVIHFVGVSTSGTSNLMVQIGDTGALETTGYLGSAGATADLFTTGFGLTNTTAANAVFHGKCVLTLEDSSDNTWTSQSIISNSQAAGVHSGAGSKSLSAVLDRVAVTTVGGSDTFDAGVINILYR